MVISLQTDAAVRPRNQDKPTGWLLTGARVARGPREAVRLDVEVCDGKIRAFRPPGRSPERDDCVSIDLAGQLLLPGLINAHDHLEFSLFPRLGRGPYPNAQAWAAEIYRPEESPVREQLAIPKRERLEWGGLKNLLSGVTTVCHHNPYEAEVFEADFPVRVIKRFGWAHSLSFSPDVARRFQQTAAGEPFILHLGEATDESGRQEIFALDAMGALSERTVLVHAVALDDEGWALVERHQAAVVWCPSSNLFTLGKTLPESVFDRNVPMALGTDSALTAEGDLFDELRVAAAFAKLGSERLYSMVTDTPAAMLRLGQGEGALNENGVADLIAIRDGRETPCEALLAARSSELGLVMVAGEVKLLPKPLAERFPAETGARLQCVVLNGEAELLVAADVAGLMGAARAALGEREVVRLAGKPVRE